MEYEGTNYTRNKVYKTYNSPTNALLIITEKAEGGKAGEKLYASGGKVEWKKAEVLGKDYLYTIHNGNIYAVSAGEVNNGKADPDAIFIIDEDHFLTPESADHFKKKMQALFPNADIDAAMRVKAEQHAKGGSVVGGVNSIMSHIKKHRGKNQEYTVNDVLNYGLGDEVYADVNFLKKAGIEYKSSKNSAWGYLKSDEDIKKLLVFLMQEDGYLARS